MRRSAALALTAGLLTVASPASAASCSLSPGYVKKTGVSWVTGYGAWVGSGCGDMKIKIQRKAWWGWDTVNDDGWYAPHASTTRVSLPAKCSGTSTWRVWMDGEKTDSRTGLTQKITC
ncbi:hypothetical protein [Nonomuraea insulae]|uniref:Secreted protein n=1 Tax=Nonomuraea insulae TaxID=1616787 RepID=A0ABW1CHM6_9ACTN